MQKFSIGDICIIIHDFDGISPPIVGEECIIRKDYGLCFCSPNSKWKLFSIVRGYEVELLSGEYAGKLACCRPEELKKKQPPAEAKEMKYLRVFIKDCERRVERFLTNRRERKNVARYS